MMSKKNKKIVKTNDATDEIDEIEEIDSNVEVEEEIVEEVKVVKKDIDEDDEEYAELTVEERIINIEKKTNTTLVLMVITVILVFVTMIFTINNGKSESTTTGTGNETEASTEYSTDAFDVIKGTDIASLSKDKLIVAVMARQGCGYCAAYAPVLGLAQEEYDFVTKYLDLADIVDMTTGTISDEDSYNALINLDAVKGYETFMEENFGRTPITLFIKDSKILGVISGYVDSDELATQLENYGISKR